MNILQAIILAIVEGITEFLPISSTGHLVLASNLLQIAQTDFVKSFEIIIQLGAILAVVWLYRKELVSTRYWPMVIAGFIPTGILGYFLYPLIKSQLIGNVVLTLVALFVGGIVLLFIKPSTQGQDLKDLSLKQVVTIGLFQAVSMIPGVSRAAATIIGGLAVGLNRKSSVKYSFFLAVPTMLAATGLDLVQNSLAFTPDQFLILGIGFVGAFISAMAAIKGFLEYVQTHDFKLFGVYRIILAVIYFLLLSHQTLALF